MGQLNEYLGFFDKANKHLRNDEVTVLLPKLELMRRADFEGDPPTAPPPPRRSRNCMPNSRKWQSEHQFKGVTAPRYGEEHRTWSVSFFDAQGAERFSRLDVGLISRVPETMSKYTQIREELEPPYVIEYSGKPGVG